MTPNQLRAARAALALGALALAACSRSESTGSVADDIPPRIVDLSVAATRDTVDVNAPVKVTVKASDNLSLKEVAVAVNAVGLAQTFVADTVFRAETPSYQGTFEIALPGVTSGAEITVTAAAVDGALNRSPLASATVVAYDSDAPVVSITAPTVNVGGGYLAGDTIRFTVAATDSSGVRTVGWRLMQNDQAGRPVQFDADSSVLSGSNASESVAFKPRLPLSLLPGQYYLVGFARDVSGNSGVSAATSNLAVRDGIPPTLEIRSVPQDTNVALGSKILVDSIVLHDNVGLRRFSLVAISTSGDPDLGAVDTLVRYDSVFAPVNVSSVAQSFRQSLTDTVVKRLLTPKSANDSISGYLYLLARVTDVAGNEDTLVRRVRLVAGPRLVVLQPAPGSSPVVQPGGKVTLQVRASDADSVKMIGYDVRGAFVDSLRVVLSPMRDTVVHTFSITVPATVAAGTSFTITPVATDRLNEPGSGASVTVAVRSSSASDTFGPLVTQTVRPRLEADDSIAVVADDREGTPVDSVRLMVVSDSTGLAIDSAKVDLTSDANATPTVSLPLHIPPAYVGGKVIIRTCAWDRQRNQGCSVRAGVTVPVSTWATAKPDTALVVYGRTFTLRQGGVIGDLAVDTIRRRAYLSNLTFDRVEAFEIESESWNPRHIAVGSDPWGLFIGGTAYNELLVANSGGTNISRVTLAGGAGSPLPTTEDVTRRIKTPNTFVAELSATLDNSGKARFHQVNFDYSDRPQYVAQTTSGDIYYSTKPTASAPDGTIRRYNESARRAAPANPLVLPDVQQIWQYAGPGEPGKMLVINADVVIVHPGTESVSDSLEICDHPVNMNVPASCVRGTSPNALATQLNAMGADVVVVNRDAKTLGLTDTTFVAASGDGHWVAFGEAHTDSAGRVMMAEDLTDYFSPGINVVDLVNNASERNFGMALNRDGSTAAVHGLESYFFDVEQPFHLRLQGKVNTYDLGAGIAFHPDNDRNVGNASTRIAFVASSNGTIEIVDTYHYTGRGILPVRASLYGPIRVTRRFPGDDPNVVLKLFGLTTEGMIVIDVRASDIKPLP